MSALRLHKGEDGDIFLDGPLALADVGAEVIKPVFAALFGRFVVLPLRAEEELTRDIAPLAVN